jgi:indole-3-glycerol phosphate synthase
VQVSVPWTPPDGVLGALVEASRERAQRAELGRAALVHQLESRPAVPSFAAALRSGSALRVIAELKRRSPSQGDLAPHLDALAQASAFASGGAAAVSVLTEPERFGGLLIDLDGARPAGLPMLRKDFIVHEIQLLEAAVHGASAVLLIARALPPVELERLHDAAGRLGLDVLVEVHDESELELVLTAGYPIVGVNNRNLQTLAIDMSTATRLLPQIPADRLAVFESGIRDAADARTAASIGADAVLVGTSISRQRDAALAVRALTGIPRRSRAR